MAVQTIEGRVEEGNIRLPGNLNLPNGARVYVVIPDEPEIIELPPLPSTVHLKSPRLANPQDAARLTKTLVVE